MTGLHDRVAPEPTVVIDPFAVPDVSHRLGDAPVRSRSVIRGNVRSIEPVTWAGGPVLEVTLTEGAGTFVLAFFGRHSVGGLCHGQQLTAAGTVGTHRGRRVMLNPYIWLIPTNLWQTADVKNLSPLELIGVD